MPLHAQSERDFDAEGERIMEVVLEEGEILSQAMVIYPTQGGWLIPLSQMADALGLGITVSPSLLGAEGFIIDENRQFQLNVSNCSVLHDGKRSAYPCRQAKAFQDEIYVTSDRLQKWFPVDFIISSLRSQILIKPREKLPEQSRREREKRAGRINTSSKDYDPGYPRVKVPYSAFEIPLVDEQLFFGPTFPSTGTALLTNSTQLSGEVLGLETAGSITNSEKQIDAWRVSFSRRSADDNLMGPLHLRKVSFLNVELPTVPLITPFTQGRGLLLSSYALDSPINFQNTDLDGTLPQGWEVFLFRNDVLLERKVADNKGRYIFSNVGLLYGRNVFRLSFYGPHGERRDEFKTYLIDSSLMKTGDHAYRFALVSLENLRQAIDFQFSQPIFSRLTAIAGVYSESNSTQYLSTSLIGVTPLFLYSLRSAFASDGGKAFEVGTQTGVGPAFLGAKYTRLYSFQSRMFPLINGELVTSQLEGSWFYVFPFSTPVGWSVDAVRKTFVRAKEQATYTNRFNLGLNNLQIQQESIYQPGSSQPLTGRLEVSYLPFAVRFRLGLEFTPYRAIAVESEAQYSKGDYSLGGLVRRQLDVKTTTYTFRASRNFDDLSLGAFVTSQSGSNYQVGLQLGASFSRDPRNGGWHSQRASESVFGAASLLAFVDENDDGIPQPNEKPIPSVTLLVNQNLEMKTGPDGIAYLTGLKPHAPSDIAVTAEGDIDPLLRPKIKGVRFIPRAGKTAQIEIPFHYVGQIDGTVSVKSTTGALTTRRIELIARNQAGKEIAHTKSDRDGFYTFEDLPGGKTYLIEPNKKYLEKWGLTASPAYYNLAIPKRGEFRSLVDFTLSQR